MRLADVRMRVHFQDNVSIKELNISGNYIGDTAAIAIGKALGKQIRQLRSK